MSRLGNLGAKLYNGDVAYDFIGRRKVWYTLSAILVLVSILGLIFLKLTLGVEFKGGAVFTVPTTSGTVEQARDDVGNAGVEGAIVQKINNDKIRITTPPISTAESAKIEQLLADKFGTTTDKITVQLVGPSWGEQITKKALQGLVIFLILVVIFLSVYFEWKMAAAALIALIHDLIITVGIYAIVGFEVTPATVIGVLTILGYSLYDTVVVFDKVRENTAGLAGGSRMTYSQAANLAVNQTLVRSINTSVVALLPVGSILVVGVVALGAGTLKDLALALFVGIAVGAYSSIFIATPLLVDFKEREPAMKALSRRVAARQSGAPSKGKAKGKVAVDPAETDEDVVVEDVEPGEEEVAAVAGQASSRPSSGTRNQPKRPQSKGKKRPGGRKR